MHTLVSCHVVSYVLAAENRIMFHCHAKFGVRVTLPSGRQVRKLLGMIKSFVCGIWLVCCLCRTVHYLALNTTSRLYVIICLLQVLLNSLEDSIMLCEYKVEQNAWIIRFVNQPWIRLTGWIAAAAYLHAAFASVDQHT